MTELLTTKPAECQFHQTYRGHVLKTKHKIKQETIDGPAEAPAVPPFHLLPPAPRLSEQQSCTSLVLYAEPDIKLASAFVSDFLCPPVLTNELIRTAGRYTEASSYSEVPFEKCQHDISCLHRSRPRPVAHNQLSV